MFVVLDKAQRVRATESRSLSTFPFPAWATRPSEKGIWAGVDDGPATRSDPFATIPGAHDDPPPF
jgi:hypothetical protein